MKTVRLGRTNLEVPVLGISAQIPNIAEEISRVVAEHSAR